MTSTAIVSDIHGDVSLLRGVLQLIGATSPSGFKQPGWTLYQVGDLVNRARTPYYLKLPRDGSITQRHYDMMLLTEQARDLACLEEAAALLDGACLGNHEGIDFGGWGFGGEDMQPSPVQERVRSLYHEGFYRASFAVGGWLISHAGLHTRFWEELGVEGLSAHEVCTLTNDLLQRDMSHGLVRPPHARPPWFWGIGAERWAGIFRMERGGGMTWCGWEELKESYAELYHGDATPGVLAQMVGHTPLLTGPKKDQTYPLVNLDVGAKRGQVCAAVTHDGGKTWETHVYRNPLKV